MKQSLAALAVLAALPVITSFKPLVSYKFEYQLSTWTQAQVTNTNNYIVANAKWCLGSDKACRITLDEANTELVAGIRKMVASKVTISAHDPNANGNFAISAVVVQTGTASFGNEN